MTVRAQNRDASPIAGGFTRRGACPALSAPMQTGDGLLVRLNPVAGGLSPKALIGLGEAALRHGNGVIEVTARGSLQIRGLTLASAPLLAAQVDALGIAVRTGVPVQAGALAGLDPDEIADPAPLAQHIRDGIAGAGLDGRLGPKVSVVVDGGGRSELEQVAADVRLTAVRAGDNVQWILALAGDAETAAVLGMGAQEDAIAATLTLLAAIGGIALSARARDLGNERIVDATKILRAPDVALATAGRNPCALTIFSLSDNRHALGVALPFGQTGAEELIAFAEKAEALGVGDIRFAPKRTILALCPDETSAQALQGAAAGLGFVVAETDPRTRISACPGAPACASGYLPARALAAEIAHEFNALPDAVSHLHISGCAKGCAHPGKTDITLVGSENGAGIVVAGTARDTPLAYTAAEGAKRAWGKVAELLRGDSGNGGDAGAAPDSARIAQVFGKQ